MQRRFEMYRFQSGVGEAQIDHVARVLRGCGDYIDEVIDSVASRDRSGSEIDLIWENAYESAESYQRYMCHPYHINILDRYLLPENPECVIGAPQDLGLGLLGYEIDEPAYRRTHGLRRIVALRLGADATPTAIADTEAQLRAAVDESEELQLSIVARNTMGEEWFPGVWSHVWEQAFDDQAALERFVADVRWKLGPPVESHVAVYYTLDNAGEDPAERART